MPVDSEFAEWLVAWRRIANRDDVPDGEHLHALLDQIEHADTPHAAALATAALMHAFYDDSIYELRPRWASVAIKENHSAHEKGKRGKTKVAPEIVASTFAACLEEQGGGSVKEAEYATAAKSGISKSKVEKDRKIKTS